MILKKNLIEEGEKIGIDGVIDKINNEIFNKILVANMKQCHLIVYSAEKIQKL